jgi:hypothetical protein
MVGDDPGGGAAAEVRRVWEKGRAARADGVTKLTTAALEEPGSPPAAALTDPSPPLDMSRPLA